MISVILPSYNHAPYLKERIDSILSQTYQDFELIILDDKSPDNSREIIEEYRNNPHVSHIVYNETNSGSTFRQWTKGIGLAKGEYIWIAESDDVAAPELLQTLYNNITQNKNVVLSYCQSYRINKDSEITGDWSDYTEKYAPELFANDFVMSGLEFIQKYYLIKNFIPNTSAVLFRKDIFIQVGGVNTEVGYITDWLCWLKILTKGKVAFSSKKLNLYRSHDKSLVTRLWNDPHNLINKRPHIDMRIAFSEYIMKNNLGKSIYNQNQKRLGKNFLEEAQFLFKHGKIMSGISYCFQSLKYLF